MENLKNIHGITLLEKCNRRVMSTYNQNGRLATPASQKEFEQTVLTLLNNMYQNSNGETHIIAVHNHLLLVSIYTDFYLILVAEPFENEIILADVLGELQSTIAHFCGKEISARMVYRYYAEIAILLNEIIDNGLILTTNTEELISRIMMQDSKRTKGGASSTNKGGVMSFFSFS